MAKAKNKVIAGDYNNKNVFMQLGFVFIQTGITHSIKIDKTTVTDYEVIDDKQSKSVASGVARGIIGGAMLGGVGALAGVASAKSKGAYQIAINFSDGKKSLLEVDDKIYNAIIKALF